MHVSPSVVIVVVVVCLIPMYMSPFVITEASAGRNTKSVTTRAKGWPSLAANGAVTRI